MLSLPYVRGSFLLETPKPPEEMSYEDWEQHGDAESALGHDDLLRRFAADVAEVGGITGACLLTRTAHDYEAQLLIVQGQDGRRSVHLYDEVSREVRELEADRFPFDLYGLLSAILAQEHRGHVRDNPAEDGGRRGRYQTVYAVVRRGDEPADAGWFQLLGLLLGGRYRNTAMNRLLLAWERVGTEPGYPLGIALYD